MIKRAEAFAMVYKAISLHNGEIVNENHLRDAVGEVIKAAVRDDRAERPDLKTAIADERAAIAEMLAVEAARLGELSRLYAPTDGSECPFAFAASNCRKMEQLIRQRSNNHENRTDSAIDATCVGAREKVPPIYSLRESGDCSPTARRSDRGGRGTDRRRSRDAMGKRE